MIPKVIVIILLTTVVVISMKLHPVKQCPNGDEWSEKAHILCDENADRYHCMFSINCTLVESCIDPQSGSFSDIDYGVYLLDVSNETGFPIFYKKAPISTRSKHFITNTPKYKEFQNKVYCEEYNKYKFLSNRTENQTKISRENCPEVPTKIHFKYNSEKAALGLAIIGVILIICSPFVIYLIVRLCKKNSNNRNRARGYALPGECNIMNEIRPRNE